jgi:hypothetical protein
MDHIQDQEDSNFAACRAAFVAAFPMKPAFVSEQCEDGEWDCPTCPFKPKQQEQQHG